MVEIIPPALMEEYKEHTAPILKAASETLPIPDFVSKTKEYLKQHPEMLREVAGEEIAEVEAWLDTLPLGLGAVGKAKINEFLGGTGTQAKGQDGVKGAPGTTFIPSDGQEQGEEQGIAAEDDLTVSEQKEVIEFMAELSEQGFDLTRIQNALRREWGLDYHYLTIRRMLAAYYGRPEPERDEKNGNGGNSQSLKIYQKLLEKNSDLMKEVAELTAKLPPEILKVDRKGVIRRFLGWLW